ncbi:MAG: response regulator [Candidatus Lokiarchaeota archaeon]|nr:response regulator [Candidatus Lokiarchaeota archaeon]
MIGKYYCRFSHRTIIHLLNGHSLSNCKTSLVKKGNLKILEKDYCFHHLSKGEVILFQILIIDDNDEFRELLKVLLKEFDLLEASTGTKGVEMYKEHNPDLVLMDILIPDKDGIQATQEILQYDPDAKIVSITAYPDQGEDILQAGAKEVIDKPVEKEELIERVIDHLGLKKIKDFIRALYDF